MRYLMYVMLMMGVATGVTGMTFGASTGAEARCRHCNDATVVRHNVRTVHRVRRPVRTVVRRTHSYQTRHVRKIRVKRIVTHIYPVIHYRRVRVVHYETLILHGKSRERSAEVLRPDVWPRHASWTGKRYPWRPGFRRW